MHGRGFSSARKSVPLSPSIKIPGLYFVGNFFPNIMEFGQENNISNPSRGFLVVENGCFSQAGQEEEEGFWLDRKLA